MSGPVSETAELSEDTTGLASERPAVAGVNETLRSYRDDGIAAEQLWDRPLRIGATPATVLAVAGLAAAIAVGWRSMVAATVGIVWFGLLGLLGAAGRESPRLQWLVPALLRIGEYASVVWLAALTGAPQAAAYGLLAAMAFHHYDIVYRLRHQLVAPPRWIDRAGGGWELRLVVALAASLVGFLDVVMIALAVWCRVLYVSDSVTSWTRVGRDEARDVEIDIDDEEAEAL